jgi:hypothetical protein
VFCGLRVSEALGADVTDLAEQRGHRVVRVMGKGGRPRTVPLPAQVVCAIEAYLNGRTAGPLFVTRSGRRWSRRDAWETVAAIGRRACVAQLHPHTFRHKAATLMQVGGVAADATFPVGRGGVAVGGLRFTALVAAAGLWAGHAVSAGVVAAGCIGCQDASSSSVAAGDGSLHLVWRSALGARRRAALVVVAGAATAPPVEPVLFEEMLAGWRRQQTARRLSAGLVEGRERLVRRFAEFTGGWPWSWTPAQVEVWIASGGWGRTRRCAPTRGRWRCSARMCAIRGMAGWPSASSGSGGSASAGGG